MSSTWLSLRAGLGNLVLWEHHQPYLLFHDFECLDSQSPQVITIIGQNLKSAVLQKLQFTSTIHSGVSGNVELFADRETLKTDAPLLIADCELHIPLNIDFETDMQRGDIVRRPLTWNKRIGQKLDPSILAHLVYAKLLAPFSTVIIIIAEDFGGIQAVVDLLAVWLTNFSNRPSDLPRETFPRVLILTQWTKGTFFNEKKATAEFIEALGIASKKMNKSFIPFGDPRSYNIINEQFGNLSVLGFPKPSSSFRTFAKLRRRIVMESKIAHEMRVKHHVAFSARHFRPFFQMASDHFCRDVVSPFSFIKASRTPNPVPPGIVFHLKTFLDKVAQPQMLNFAVPIIASALAFDNYLEEMHKFDPIVVFRELFHNICLQVDPLDPNLQEGKTTRFTSSIEVSFCQYVYKLTNESTTSTLVHARVLLRFKELWAKIFSNITCFCCLSQTPQRTLTCRHALCDTCIMSYGNSHPSELWTFILPSCPLCEVKNEIIFPMKPNTAGVRVLITEGGGIKGVIPLTFLKKVEDELNLPMKIQEHFDIAFGSSSGALITLGLFINKWGVEECTEQFLNLSKTVFRRRKYFGISLTHAKWLRTGLEFLCSFTTDSKYSSDGINKALKAAYSDYLSLFGSACATKVGIIATTTDKSMTCVLANYNRPMNRALDCGYQLVRPVDLEREMAVWEAARASSAAPPYFKSFMGYQDGGLGGHNNPIHLGLWEQDKIWARENKQPDIVLSLGTGFKRSTTSSPNDISFVQARYIPRLFRSFMNVFVGETRWQELRNSLPRHFQDRYHRLNIEFFGLEPELDDTSAIENLIQQAESQASLSDDTQRCADKLLCSLFYLELDRIPQFDGAAFLCHGRILCRIGPSHAAFAALIIRLKHWHANFNINQEQLVSCINKAGYSSTDITAAFLCPVTFKVLSLQDSVSVQLEGIVKDSGSISNCPYKLETLIKDQGFHCVFGNRSKIKHKLNGDRQDSQAKRVKA